MEKHTPSYVKWIKPVGICGVTRALNPELCDNAEGRDGAGGGRGVQEGGDLCIPMADSC